MKKTKEPHLPQVAILEVKDLPPMVEMTFGMSDEDFDRLTVLALMEIPAIERRQLLVGELLRRALVEICRKKKVRHAKKK